MRLILLMLLLSGCSQLTVDPSMEAVDAGDYTLVHSACEGTPGLGLDSCIVKEGSEIDRSWQLIIPSGHRYVLGGEVDVYYKGIHKQYPIKKDSEILEIKWDEFFGKKKWSKDLDGEVLALVLLKYDKKGIIEIAKFRGIAKIIVIKQGYSRMPIGSGFSGWETDCKIQYSTAGRGALECK